MDYIIKTVGLLTVVVGVVFFVRPLLIRSMIEFAKVGNRVYIGAVARIVVGVLLLLAAKSASIAWIPALFGSLTLLLGILVFVLGVARVHRFLDWVYQMPDSKLHIPATVVGIAGALLIYSL